MIATTLLFLVQGDPIVRVLLGFKKVGFGQGKYTGIGGKLEPGETISEAAIRELREETHVCVEEKHLMPLGHIDFYFPAKPAWDLTIHIFLSNRWQGTPKETAEIRPQWFDVAHLPFESMWDDASYWYVHVLQKKKIHATFTFKSDNETVDTYLFHDG